MLKKVLIVVAVLAVLAAVGLFLLGSNLGRVVKAGIEKFGPEFTQSPVTVAKVDLSPRSGSGSLTEFVVGNPAGYTSPHALRIGHAHFDVDASSLLKDKVIIEQFVLDQPEITLEGGLTDNNLKKLQANLDRFTAGEKDKPATETGATKKLQVNRFRVAGAKVNAQLNLPAVGAKNLSLTLPDIEFSNLGTGPEGITPAELSDKLINEVVKAVIPAVTAQVNNLIRDPAGAAKALTDKAGQTGDALNKATKGVGDLFKKK